MTSGRFKLMRDRDQAELDQTIKNGDDLGKLIKEKLQLTVNPFWELMAGIDAYQEKRRRAGKGPKED